MKDLKINNNTTLCFPDEDDEVQICLVTYKNVHREYVSFEKLEKWVAVIRGQMITISNEQAINCHECKHYIDSDVCESCNGYDQYTPVG